MITTFSRIATSLHCSLSARDRVSIMHAQHARERPIELDIIAFGERALVQASQARASRSLACFNDYVYYMTMC